MASEHESAQMTKKLPPVADKHSIRINDQWRIVFR